MKSTSLVLAVATSACSVIPHDVTNSAGVRDAGWSTATVYTTTKPTFLAYESVDNRYWLARSNAEHLPSALAYQCGSFSLPRTLEEYRKNPSKWPEVQRIVMPGAKVRFEEARNLGFPYGGELNGRTIDGTLVEDGKSVPVRLECIATADTEKAQWQRDDQWLRE